MICFALEMTRMKREIGEDLLIPKDRASSLCFTTHHDSPSHVCFLLFPRMVVVHTELYSKQSSKQLIQWEYIQFSISQLKLSMSESYFSFGKATSFFSCRKQNLMVQNISWNLKSINNSSVEHLKYTTIPSLM